MFIDAERGVRRKKDLIGHAFIILESPASTRVVGFYPEQVSDFVFDRGAFWCITQRGLRGELLDDEHFLSDPHYECRIATYQIGRRQHAEAEKFIARFEESARSGRIRYHAFSQCANFALQALHAAGVGRRLWVPYPPFLHWWMHARHYKH